MHFYVAFHGVGAGKLEKHWKDGRASEGEEAQESRLVKNISELPQNRPLSFESRLIIHPTSAGL